ncbi:MAG: hypothetical protein KKG04_08475 [Candidatus Thermoplasmatota archaeon]|nr:hypothetical protein [Candidatus Thermoplasmatota archaeon]
MIQKTCIPNFSRIVNKAVILAIILLVSAIAPISVGSAYNSNRNTRATTTVSLSGWDSQVSGTTQTLTGVSFVDTTRGTVVGNSATILHTENEGTTWNPQTCSVAVNLLDVSFFDTNIGMAVGHEGTIVETTNGGSIWNTFQTGWMTSYYGAHMVTGIVGFAVGVNTIFQPLVTWTTNGWSSKNDVAFYLEHSSVMHEGQLRDVCLVDASTGFAAAAVWNGEGAIARTTNGGWTWDTVFWAPQAFQGIDFASADVGYAVGNNGIIAKTINGGTTWSLLTSGVSTNLYDVSFPSEDIGTAVGASGLILRTEDGGALWDIQDSGTTYRLNSVIFLDPTNGFAVGDHGTILHTTTGGTTNQPPDTPTTPSGPSEGITDIDYEFITSTDDPDGDDVYYWFDWGDGTTSGWIGPYPSGTSISMIHAWNTPGDFSIIVKAKDGASAESPWSSPYIIHITIAEPHLTISNVQGGFGKITATIENTGIVDAENVAWRISVHGGLLGRINITSTGTIPIIPAGKQATDTIQTTQFIFGLGTIVFGIQVDYADPVGGSAKVFLPLVFGIQQAILPEVTLLPIGSINPSTSRFTCYMNLKGNDYGVSVSSVRWTKDGETVGEQNYTPSTGCDAGGEIELGPFECTEEPNDFEIFYSVQHHGTQQGASQTWEYILYYVKPSAFQWNKPYPMPV